MKFLKDFVFKRFLMIYQMNNCLLKSSEEIPLHLLIRRRSDTFIINYDNVDNNALILK